MGHRTLRGERVSLDCIIDHPDAPIEQLLKILKGPDLPSGGVIVNPEDLPNLYQEGQGTLKVRARTQIAKDDKEGVRYLWIRELPYGYSSLEFMAYLVRDCRCEVRPVSENVEPGGFRVDLRVRSEHDEDPQKILDDIRGFEREIHVRMAVLDSGQEKVVSLKDLLKAYIENLCGLLGQKRGSRERLRKAFRRWKDIAGQPRTTIAGND